MKMIKNWFLSRKKLIAKVNKLNIMLDNKMDIWVRSIEELDQHKAYILQIPGASQDDIQNINSTLHQIKNRMRWTPPEIILINARIEELNLENLKELMKIAKKKEKVKT